MNREPRRGGAMPMVLFGMALAIAIASLGWSRSWTRRTVSAHASIEWQARLLAESATACALREAAARTSAPARDTTSRDTTSRKTVLAVRDTSDSVCGFRGPSPGSMSWDPPAGTQLLSVHARGQMTESGKPVPVGILSTWGGAPPPDPFSPALSLWDRNAGIPRLGGRIRGEVRLRLDGAAPPGFKSQPSGGIQQFVPTSIGSDTAAAIARMTAAFRSESAVLGGDRFGPAHPPPGAPDSLVFTLGDVVFEGPWSGEPWRIAGSRTLIVEGRVEFRGKVEIAGWRILAKGPVVFQDESSARRMDVFSLGGIRFADRARASGQFLSKGSILLSGSAVLSAPSFAATWPGTGSDSAPRIALLDRSAAVAYAVALGPTAEIRLSGGSDFRGVVVSGGVLRNDGTLRGVGVAGRVDCGQGAASCSSGSFDRPSLPADFAFPLGLPGNQGLRLVAWEIAR